MWVQAGCEPDSFWEQTPASFQAIMQGVRKRMRQDAEAQLAQAHHTAAFLNAAMAGKLKKLEHYLKPETSAGDLVKMIAAMGAGSDMKIERIAND